MNTRPLPAAACGAAAGLGLWATRGSLDRMAGPGTGTRVAMLPSLGDLAICVGAGALIAVVAHHLLSRLLRTKGADDAAALALAPLLVLSGAAVLGLPYLPWLPDWLPALALLAGPGARLAWSMLGALAVWVLVADTVPAARRPIDATHQPRALTPGETRARRRRWTTAIFLASALSAGLLAQRFTRTPLFPGGDEPHYLVIAQSLWRDGDLRIENNHARGDYDEYFHRPLAPHYLTRGVDRQIYSIHPIGMPLLMTPVYALGGYDLVVAAFVLLAAGAMTIAWRLAWAVTGSAGGATAAWAIVALGPPWIFNTFAVYPEVPAAAAVALAFAWTAGWQAEHGGHRRALALPVWRWWAAGASIAALPWFSTKYLVMGALLGAVSLLRAWVPWPTDRDARRAALVRTLAVSLPNVVGLAAWFLFFKVIWGTWSPTAPYGSQRETRLEYLPSGGPGLLFDQEYGIVAFAPALLMVLPGLWVLWHQRGARRRLVIELVAVFAALLGVVGAFHIWWGGSAIVGRPLVSGLPLLILPVAAQWAACHAQAVRRAAQRVLLAVGLALTVLLAGAQSGLLLVAGRDGSSQVLEYLAPSTPVWTSVPSFLRQAPLQAWAGVVLWGGLALGVGWMLGRRGHATSPGRAQLTAWVAVIATGALGSGLAHGVLPPSTDAPALDARPRVRLLDDFDAAARPIAVRYDPFSTLEIADVPGLFPLLVHAEGDRREDRATQLFGRRLSLPAGTYGVDLVFPGGTDVAPVDGTLAVHAGRTSPPLEAWTVSVVPPGSWGRRFSLPVDIGFVGFRASDTLAEASPRLRLTPERIVDASARPRTPAVLASARLSGLGVLVHGEDAWPEPTGLWLRGRTTVMLTLVWPDDEWRTFDLRAGAVPVTVTVEWGATRQSWSLTPGEIIRTVIAPPAGRAGQQGRAGQLRLTSSSGFIPADVEPGSRDRRLLGAWLELGRLTGPPGAGAILGGLRHDAAPAAPATGR